MFFIVEFVVVNVNRFFKHLQTKKINIEQRILARRKLFSAVKYFREKKLSKTSKMFKKRSASLLKKNITKSFIRKIFLKIPSKKMTISFNFLFSHVLILAERLGRVKNSMTIDWTKIHENQSKLRTDIKIFFSRLVKHNLDANISMIVKIREDRKRLIAKIMNMKKENRMFKSQLKKMSKRIILLKSKNRDSKIFFDYFHTFFFLVEYNSTNSQFFFRFE